MKFKIIYFGTLLLIILLVSMLYSGSASLGEESTIMSGESSVTYTIPDWNTSGSFILLLGTSKIGSGNKVVGFIKILDKDRNVITELTPEKIQNQIDNISSVSFNRSTSKTKMRKVEDYKYSLTSLKNLMEDPKKFQTLMVKIKSKNVNTIQGTRDWSTILAPGIRDYNLEVSGSLSD